MRTCRVFLSATYFFILVHLTASLLDTVSLHQTLGLVRFGTVDSQLYFAGNVCLDFLNKIAKTFIMLNSLGGCTECCKNDAAVHKNLMS